MISRYVAERTVDESFQVFIKRIGKAECKRMLDDLTQVPPHDVDGSFYQDWGDAREYTVGDLGAGECAGEVVSPTEFALTACEREVFEAQLRLESGDAQGAAGLAYESMLHGALALVRYRIPGFSDNSAGVVDSFRELFYDTQLFYDPFAGGKFAQYFFNAHEQAGAVWDSERSHYLIEEAQLFIEACHSCYARLLELAKPVLMRA
ncbi:MAG: nitrite/sulfite reductase, partial [Bryobacteraceae bacterium]|nr:nitrite/sulfite reductase [Bryobacteraceae bacterium]